MPALAPATTNTLAAASTGAQLRFRPGKPPSWPRLPVPGMPRAVGVSEPERDVFDRDPARRLRGNAAQHLR